MLTVVEHDLIRRKHLVDGMSQRAIPQEPGYVRNTVAKAIAHAIPFDGPCAVHSLRWVRPSRL